MNSQQITNNRKPTPNNKQQITNHQYLQALLELAQGKTMDSEQRFIINMVSGTEYEHFLQEIGDKAGVLVKYFEQNLEIMSPSGRHEFYKENIGILLECFCLEKGIKFYSLGSKTLRSESGTKGIEPDKSYAFFSYKEVPDLAIEVIITSGGLDSLGIYQSLEVAEVWFWKQEKLEIYGLQDDQYVKCDRSLLLPELDVEQFAQYIIEDEPFDAVAAFRKQLRGESRSG